MDGLAGRIHQMHSDILYSRPTGEPLVPLTSSTRRALDVLAKTGILTAVFFPERVAVTDDPVPHFSRRWRWAWWLLAYVSLALGIVGVVLPVVPTTPFILLAAYAAARGSQRLRDWLLAHAVMGPMIRDWNANGAVSRKAKWMATAMMAMTAAILFLFSPRWWLAVGITVMMGIVATWLWLRPEPPGSSGEHP